MSHERYYPHPPQTVFQCCINAVACVKWGIEHRDGSELTMHIRTPFTMSDFSLTFQDKIDVEVIPEDDGARVWVDSNPRFQLWNWGKDKRNEKKLLDGISREAQLVASQQQQQHEQQQHEQQQHDQPQPRQGQSQPGQRQPQSGQKRARSEVSKPDGS